MFGESSGEDISDPKGAADGSGYFKGEENESCQILVNTEREIFTTVFNICTFSIFRLITHIIL